MFINNNNTNNSTNIDSSFNNSKGINLDFKKIGVIAAIVIVLLLGIIFIPKLFTNSNKKDVFKLNEGDITIYKGINYIDLGCIATDKDGNDISTNVQIEGNVNTSKVGAYSVTYKLDNKTITRKVTVVERKSINSFIKLNGSKTVELTVGQKYKESGYQVIDSTAESSKLEKQVKIFGKVDSSKPGTYRIIYTFLNSEGVTSISERVVIVK